MGLIRTALLGLAIWLIIYIVRRLLRGPARPPQQGTAYGGHMVRCARCGLHVPEAEAIRADKLYYCTPEHRDQDRA